MRDVEIVMKSVVPDVPLPAYTSQGLNEESKAVFDEYDAIDIKYKDLLGKRILLTGASSGIGRQTARKLLRSGVYLIVLGRNLAALEELQRDPKARGVVKIYECDIEKPVQLEETFFKVMEENDGKLDGLVNTVGTSLCADFRDTTLKEFDFLMNINVRTAMQLMSMASSFLRESHGVIVNVSAPDIAMPKATLFCVTKACLNMLTQCAALELGSHGVRVNAVAPGFVNTPMRMNQRGAPISQAENDALLREAGKCAPLRRTATDKEVADCIVWLVSEQSSFVNGEIVNVDCGATITATTSDLSWHKPKIAVSLYSGACPSAQTNRSIRSSEVPRRRISSKSTAEANIVPLKMALTVLGGSSPLGRFLLRSLGGAYTDVRLADMYPFREAVYRLQEEIAPRTVSKFALSFPASLRLAVGGAEHVVVVTHDYFKLAHSKNFFVERAAFLAREMNVKRLTLVCPIAYDQLNPMDGNPEKLIETAISRAKAYVPSLSVLRTNLIFGPHACDPLFSYALEAFHRSKPPLFPHDGRTKFRPVHESDVLAAFHALSPKEERTVVGPEVLSWGEMVTILRGFVGKSDVTMGGGAESLRSAVARNAWIGDFFYASQIQQLYWLLAKDRTEQGTDVGKKTFKDAYPAGGYKSLPDKYWWRVILD